MPFDIGPDSLGPAFTASALPQWVFDPATLRILAVNDAAMVRYGLAPDEFCSMTILHLHPPEEQDAVRSYATGPAGEFLHSPVWRHLTPLGEHRVRMAFADVSTLGREARLVQVLDVSAEVTLKHELDEAIRRETEARARAEAISRAKDALFATVGHELRQPLTPLLTATAIMEQRISRGAGIRAREIIKRQVGLLTRLVDDLLDAARVQQGKITLERETQDLRSLVEEVVASHAPDLSAHGITVATALPATPVWVSIDGTRFHQILSNLLANAIRHSEEGGHIRVRLEVADDGEARLVVSDDGRGIDAEVLPHIFERFAQAAPGAKGGLGIGLSVVRALAELHGGRVEAASGGSGHGAEFVVSLPIVAAPPISADA